MLDRLFDDVAYIARYGNQPMSEVFSLSALGRRKMIEALSRIVARENESGKK